MGDELYQQLLQELRGKLSVLPDKPEETTESTLHTLWCAAAGNPMSVELAATVRRPPLGEADVNRLRLMIEKRIRGMPLAHITGRQHFMGVEFLVGPGALVPRKETEILARAALEKLQAAIQVRGAAVVMDVCCGAGNLALSLAMHAPASKVYAADISPGCIRLTLANIEQLGLADRVMVRQGDLLEPFDAPEFHGKVDVLTCNPPYISSAKVGSMHDEIRAYEPREAFDGGPFGIRIVQRLLRDAMRFLRPGGWLAFEVGLGQGSPILQRMRRERQYLDVVEVYDAAGQIRVILARL